MAREGRWLWRGVGQQLPAEEQLGHDLLGWQGGLPPPPCQQGLGSVYWFPCAWLPWVPSVTFPASSPVPLPAIPHGGPSVLQGGWTCSLSHPGPAGGRGFQQVGPSGRGSWVEALRAGSRVCSEPVPQPWTVGVTRAPISPDMTCAARIRAICIDLSSARVLSVCPATHSHLYPSIMYLPAVYPSVHPLPYLLPNTCPSTCHLSTNPPSIYEASTICIHPPSTCHPSVRSVYPSIYLPQCAHPSIDLLSTH